MYNLSPEIVSTLFRSGVPTNHPDLVRILTSVKSDTTDENIIRGIGQWCESNQWMDLLLGHMTYGKYKGPWFDAMCKCGFLYCTVNGIWTATARLKNILYQYAFIASDPLPLFNLGDEPELVVTVKEGVENPDKYEMHSAVFELAATSREEPFNFSDKYFVVKHLTGQADYVMAGPMVENFIVIIQEHLGPCLNTLEQMLYGFLDVTHEHYDLLEEKVPFYHQLIWMPDERKYVLALTEDGVEFVKMMGVYASDQEGTDLDERHDWMGYHDI